MKTIKIPESMMLMTCGACGHEDDYFAFCETEITGPLPPNQYQCPKCRTAWEMRTFEKGQYFPSGLWIPPGKRSVKIDSVL